MSLATVWLAIGIVLVFTTGCRVMKDPAFWAAMAQSRDQRSGSYNPTPSSFQTHSPLQPSLGTGLLTRLEGCIIVAEDGEFLGRITRNEFAPDCILNEFGRHGSPFSPVSIFNEFGKYGGNFSPLSPFNQFTGTPPKIVNLSGRLMGYLTKNDSKVPAIDPHLLIGLMKSAK